MQGIAAWLPDYMYIQLLYNSVDNEIHVAPLIHMYQHTSINEN